MGRLVSVDTGDGDAFVASLQRAWDAGDAVFPLDHRLALDVRERLAATMRVGDDVEDGDALVIATSGTTGEPRGAVLTHDALAASARAVSARLAVDPATDRWLACLPLAHVGGLSAVVRALLTGTPLTVHAGFDAAAVTAARATLVSLVPTALARVDPARFRWVVLGGSAPPRERPANVVATYGMTETGSGVAYDGVALDGVELAIVEGEIRVRAPMLLRCYRDGRDPKDADGWFATGDAGALASDGRLTVHGRVADLIVTGGENVWPAAVEAVLAAHAGVAAVAVAGRPDPEWGQRVVAFVVPRDAAAPPALDDLRALVRERLAPWAAPRELVLVEDLPRTSIGKVRRAGLSYDAAATTP